MFYRVKSKWHHFWFDTQCKGVLATPPLEIKDAPVRVVTMVSHRDFIMYLVAVKSLYPRLGQGRVVVLNDGTLTARDQELLYAHIPLLEIVHIGDVPTGKCQKGGTWERLLLISTLVKDAFVIQMDSDMVTSGDLSEVQALIRDETSFAMLGSGSVPKVETMAECAAHSKGLTHPHIQAVVEKNFDRVPDCEHLKYMRATSAFAGFFKGSFTREDVERYHEMMAELFGREKWTEWGSEQITSNIVVSNTARVQPLPVPKYVSYWPERPIDYHQAAMIHFMGVHRYDNGFYIARANGAIKAMMNGKHA